VVRTRHPTIEDEPAHETTWTIAEAAAEREPDARGHPAARSLIEGARSMEALGWVLLFVFAYVASLYLNPWKRCPKCKGRARFRARVFRYAHHDCPRCAGRGRVFRRGSAVLAAREASRLRRLPRNRNLPRRP
jgi:hypothetical protein